MDATHSILERHAYIAAAWLYGSEARGEARPDSDIDLAILLRDRGDTAVAHWEDLLTLTYDLGAVWPDRQIDLVVLADQGPVFCHRVISEGRLIYEADPDRRVDFESDTCVRYFDFKPTYDLATRGRLAAIRRQIEAKR